MDEAFSGGFLGYWKKPHSLSLAKILLNASIDEFIRHSQCFINGVYPQSAEERGYDVFLLACILAEQRDHT